MMGGKGDFPNSGHRTALKLSLIFFDEFLTQPTNFLVPGIILPGTVRCHCVWHLSEPSLNDHGLAMTWHKSLRGRSR